MQKQDNDKLSFEQALHRLEEIVGKLESGDVSLDDSISLYEEASTMSAYCSEQLENAELRIEQVNQNAKASPESHGS